MLRPLLLASVLALPAQIAPADVASGPYLAARQAQATNDFEASARYLGQAMSQDPENMGLLEQLTGALISLGDVERAQSVALRLVQEGGSSQLANLALLASQSRSGSWEDILSDMDAGLSVGPLFDGLAKGWAQVGDGQIDTALASFDAVAAEEGLAPYGNYHKALALALEGRFEEADAVLSQDGLRLARRGLVAHAQILTQLGRFDDAAAVLSGGFGNGSLDGSLQVIMEAIEAGEPVPFDIVESATDGVAEAAFDIGSVLGREADPAYTLLYARVVTYLRPDHIEAILMTASLLDELDQQDLAVDALETVPQDDPAWLAAEIGRAEILLATDQVQAGVEALRQLARAYPEEAVVQLTLGDALAEQKQFAAAERVYSETIDLLDADAPDRWRVYFARAVARERLDDWENAESDFREALAINEDNPAVLNYLGYSLIDRGEKLEEALDMIERAVTRRPDSGAIVDSLGWGFYRLARYAEAVEPMERAVRLMPVDPVVNDHLGDVYWMVGRKLEARFQWQRALSFVDNDQNDEVDADRIRRKLEVGLDAVLEQEGGAPDMANDGG